MLIKRKIQSQIQNCLFKNKAIVIYGPRQIGKTTLINQLLISHKNSRYLSCDEPDIRRALTEKTSTELKAFIGNIKLVAIDEAQRVKNIGLTLKLLIDNYPDTQIIATGSSSFDLSNKIKEPLTGRIREFYLYPLSIAELNTQNSLIETNRLLENMLIFGNYPEIISSPQEREKTITHIANNYLYKDALEFQQLKNPEVIENLIRALALQIGSLVSYSELANLLNIDQKTVAKYIRILEQALVIFRLNPYSGNLRKAIGRKRKIYFWDTGIRNALINNFNPLGLRNDAGFLWENFIIAQRLIKHQNSGKNIKPYFFRTWDKQEVDLVEEGQGKISGFEIKFKDKHYKIAHAWKQTYPKSQTEVISKKNWLDFIK